MTKIVNTAGLNIEIDIRNTIGRLIAEELSLIHI